MSVKILENFHLNEKIYLKNRVVMAPLTRCFADPGHLPTDLMAEYYGRRADVGLIISEATVIHPSGHGYPNTPGIYSPEQVEGWKKVTAKVHQNGGKIFLQLWHVGRTSHPYYLDGKSPVAPSKVPLTGPVPRAEGLEYGEVRALENKEVYEIIKAYVQGAKNAIEAGFDGVEIHGANGYLIDQFLRGLTNKREDEFGGSIENKSRFALEIIDGIVQAIGSERVGIRLSPGAYFNMEHTPGDEKSFIYLLEALSEKGLAYVHTGIFDDGMNFDYLEGGATAFLRKHYKGVLIASGSYSFEKGNNLIENSGADLIAIGRDLIANHDYINRVSSGEKLKEYDASLLGTLY